MIGNGKNKVLPCYRFAFRPCKIVNKKKRRKMRKRKGRRGRGGRKEGGKETGHRFLIIIVTFSNLMKAMSFLP